MEGFCMPFRVDRNIHGGGVFAYIREDIPRALLKTHIRDDDLEGYGNIILLGDFNSEIKEISMREFCDVHNLRNLIKQLTCFKNPANPSFIDVILTNKFKIFQNSTVFETGVSDHP